MEETLIAAFYSSVAPSQWKNTKPTGRWERLVVAQHYGIPTRLSDWTESPLVGLFFATRRDSHDQNAPEPDGVLWLMQSYPVMESQPSELRDSFRAYPTYPYGSEVLPLDFLEPNFDPLDPDPSWGNFLLFLNPPTIDERIAAQQSVFLYLSNPMIDVCRACVTIGHRHLWNPLVKVIIPSAVKPVIRGKLLDFGVSISSLFPGIESIATDIRGGFRHSDRATRPHSPQQAFSINYRHLRDRFDLSNYGWPLSGLASMD